jgi:acetyltransferase-like isoleucine patch superfamily enzyme
LERMEFGAYSRVGRFNWVSSATAFARAPGVERGIFALGDHAALMSRHYVDCSGGVEIGSFSTVAGVRSTILTHEVDPQAGRQVTASVAIGDYCLISSNVSIAPGAKIPDRCVVGMGAVVAGALEKPDTLYAGIPARPIRGTGSGKYFSRSVGHVESDD